MRTFTGLLNQSGEVAELGGLVLFFRRVARATWEGLNSPEKKEFKHQVFNQIWSVILRSFSTVAFSAVFVGAILVLQFFDILKIYQATTLLGGLNSSAIIREIGPLLISFILAGKVGAFTTAELGTMRVTEQIDAIECLGTHPIRFLIAPRFLGIILGSLLLLALGLMISVVGSAILGQVICGINFSEYLSSVARFVSFWTFFGGFFKSLLFGVVVATVCCFKGFTASGGAQGVGRAVTQAAVTTNLLIVLMDFLSSGLLEWLEKVGFHA